MAQTFNSIKKKFPDAIRGIITLEEGAKPFDETTLKDLLEAAR